MLRQSAGMKVDPGSITTIANHFAGSGGSRAEAAERRLYRELSVMAHRRVRSLGFDAELRTGDLVNAAYIKLFGRSADEPWQNRAHFFGSAARAMQQVVIQLVREAEIRRAHAPRLAMDAERAGPVQASLTAEELLRLLEELERVDPLAAEVLRIRVFAGVSVRQISVALEMPLRNAQRKWTIARGLAHAWLAARMDRCS